MPMITSFYGIIIYIYFKNKEHNPPHFHAQYGEHEGIFDIRTLEMIDGELPPNAKRMAKEWGALHQAELMNIWETQNFKKLPPLE